MCNCGNKRETLTQSLSLSGSVTPDKNPPGMWADSSFEYTGKSGLTITGFVTGKKYRFNHPGDVQLIDYRDASAMAGVPVLKKVRQQE